MKKPIITTIRFEAGTLLEQSQIFERMFSTLDKRDRKKIHVMVEGADGSKHNLETHQGIVPNGTEVCDNCFRLECENCPRYSK